MKKINKADNKRKLNMKKLLITLGIICLIAVICIIIKQTSGTPVESESEGDIFSRGFDKDNEMSVIAEEIPTTLQSSLNRKETDIDNTVLAVYEEMQRDNPDFVGYLKIDGTNIDYPVMYSPEKPEKYLDRDINDIRSSKGLPFIDARCKLDPVSDNIIIYAHNMKDGSMFGTLSNYETIEYCKEHPVIKFDTVNELGEYEVMYAFYDKVYFNEDPDFRFYDFIDAENEEEYDRSIAEYRNKSIYDTGVNAHYGDKLITLVTCSYQEDNGRFVVVAKRSTNH